LWDATVCSTWPAQIPQCGVRDIVGDFSDSEERNTQVCEERIALPRSRGVGAIGPVCQVQTREDPVVARVLVDVADGHCRAAEAVDEQSLVLAFGEVNDAHEKSETLEG
jgi:hypothetical protein